MVNDTNDRPFTVTFSVRPSSFSKLQKLIASSGKNRSELLSSWIDRESEAVTTKPAELAKEPT
ncbi:MAG TPA: hypothetical protein DIW44_12375 [Anaerolineaceae bacterium]|nr:hypothetical protein [Anaerolineaceae bacterium]